MVQKATATSKRLGRRPSFNPEEVVSAATLAFWSKGFGATTLSDLEEATGADRSTLYNSFGGKKGLYVSATAAYLTRAEEYLFAPLHAGDKGVDDIIEFLDRLADTLGSGNYPPGCLIVNDMAAAVDQQATNRYLQMLEGGLLAALERSAASGETDPSRTDQRSRHLAAAVLGINLANRSAPTTAASQRLIDGVRSEVSAWAGAS